MLEFVFAVLTVCSARRSQLRIRLARDPRKSNAIFCVGSYLSIQVLKGDLLRFLKKPFLGMPGIPRFRE